MYIGILLNITPDHLDRYQGELKNYAESKMKILRLVKNNGHFVYCQDDEIVADEIEKRETTLVTVVLEVFHEDIADGRKPADWVKQELGCLQTSGIYLYQIVGNE
mgnify:CR=1 FL=1